MNDCGRNGSWACLDAAAEAQLVKQRALHNSVTSAGNKKP